MSTPCASIAVSRSSQRTDERRGSHPGFASCHGQHALRSGLLVLVNDRSHLPARLRDCRAMKVVQGHARREIASEVGLRQCEGQLLAKVPHWCGEMPAWASTAINHPNSNQFCADRTAPLGRDRSHAHSLAASFLPCLVSIKQHASHAAAPTSCS